MINIRRFKYKFHEKFKSFPENDEKLRRKRPEESFSAVALEVLSFLGREGKECFAPTPLLGTAEEICKFSSFSGNDLNFS